MILAVGRLKAGPERHLVERYRDRIVPTGRACGVSGFEIVEITESRARRDADRRAEEGEAIMARLADAPFVLLDERGQSPTSAAFAERLRGWRSAQIPALAFVIGGPDGVEERLRAAAAWTISFGSLTIPHQIVRALVAEQIYRALTMLSGHPYHRSGETGP